jgi:methylated-DNA-[protein]-cysteine S-methyltransferase
MELSYASITSPVGTWTVEGTEFGLTRVFMPHETAPAASPLPSAPVALAARQLDEYFAGTRTDFNVSLAETSATAFQYDVWRVLRSLPYGSVATYRRVAELAGRPRAARAVGNANHANPWPVIVPCHRVVASDGLGGYGGGEDVKRYLLALEGVEVNP